MSLSLRRVLLGLLILGGVINYADRQIIAILKPAIEADLHWSDLDYGRLTSVFQLAAAASFLAAGWIVDRVGLRWANPAGVAAWSVAAMVQGVCRTLSQFTFARIALGATESIGTPSAVKSIAAWFDARERPMALGAMNAGTTAGAVVTPLVIPSIAVALGWRASFVLVGAAGFVWAALWILATTGRPLERSTVSKAAETGARVDWVQVLRERRTWAIAGAKVLSDQVWWLLLFWTPDLFHRVFHLTMKQTAVPLALVYTCAAAGSLLGGFVSARLLSVGFSLNAARKLTLFGSALLVLPAPLILHVQNYWTAVALLGLMLAAHQSFSVNVFAIVTDVTPAEKVGSVTAIGALFGNLAGMAILATAGWLLARGYGYAPLFDLAACSYLLAVGWIQLLLPVLRSADPTEHGGTRLATA